MLQEIRADVAAARERDPAAQGVSTFEILISWAGVQALLAHRVAARAARGGRAAAAALIAYLTPRGHRGRDPPGGADRRRVLHRPRLRRGDRRDRRDRRPRHPLPGGDPGRHRLPARQAPPDPRRQRHRRLRRQAARPDRGRRRRQDRRQHGRRRGRAAGRDRGRQPRPPGQGRRQAGRRARRRLDPPARPDRRGDQGALGADRRGRAAAWPQLDGGNGSRHEDWRRSSPRTGRSSAGG